MLMGHGKIMTRIRCDIISETAEKLMQQPCQQIAFLESVSSCYASKKEKKKSFHSHGGCIPCSLINDFYSKKGVVFTT